MSNYLERLKSMVRDYDKVILFKCRAASFWRAISEAEVREKRVLLLFVQGDAPPDIEPAGISVEVIPEKEAEEFISLYHTYEFTDRFMVCEDKGFPAASISNFVESELLTADEMWQALLV